MIFLDQFPDCESCKEPTKKVTGRTIDFGGPGKFGKLYSCDNNTCKKKRDAVAGYHIRKEHNNHDKKI